MPSTGESQVIIGAGQAGANAALAMRQAGFTGRIALIGDEVHPPYERPPLSKDALTALAAPDPTHVLTPAQLAEHDITLLLGNAAVGIDTVDRRVTTKRGERIAYDNLLLATGGRARRLPIPGAEHVLTLRTLDDAQLIRDRLSGDLNVVCIGAGVIGLEIAAAARMRGCSVTVLEAGARAMGRSLPPDFAAFMERLHRDAGVNLRFGAAVSAIEAGTVVVDGERIPADCVVAGIGIVRSTELAEAAGAACDNGIVVDAFARSSLANIYAAGDVAAFWHPRLQRRLRLEAWRHAQNHGIAAGRAMVGEAAPYQDTPWFWTDQFGTNLQVAGLPEDGRTTVLRGDPTGRSFAAFYCNGEGAVVGAIGINAPRDVRAAMSLIESSAKIDPLMLSDITVNLQKIARR